MRKMHVHAKCVWKCYTKCLNYDARTHIYELCVCAPMPCKRKKNLDTLASKYAMFPLKTRFAQDVASSPLRLLSSKESPKQQLIQIKRFLQWNQANRNKGSYNLPLWLFHGKTSSSPYIDHSNKLNVDSIISSSHYKEIPRLKGLQVFLSLQESLLWTSKYPWEKKQPTREFLPKKNGEKLSHKQNKTSLISNKLFIISRE